MVFYLIALLSGAGLAVVGSLTFWPVTHWYDFYIPIVLFIAGLVAGFCIDWIFLDLSGRITVKKGVKYDKAYKFNRWCLNSGLACIRRLALITCKVKGKNKMPKNRRFLLVCNHRSNFDNFLITDKLLFNTDAPFVTKGSNYKIPLAKFHMHKCLYEKIDRDDLLQSLQVMKTCEERIANDVCSYCIFPEGKRSKDGKVDQFHEGVFGVALKAKCPIVVCSLQGTEKIHKRYPLITRTKLNVIQVLEYEEFYSMTSKALADQVREMIINDLEKQPLK